MVESCRGIVVSVCSIWLNLIQTARKPLTGHLSGFDLSYTEPLLVAETKQCLLCSG